MPILGQVQNELESRAAAISEKFDILVGPRRPGDKLRSSPLNEAFAAALLCGERLSMMTTSLARSVGHKTYRT